MKSKKVYGKKSMEKKSMEKSLEDLLVDFTSYNTLFSCDRIGSVL